MLRRYTEICRTCDWRSRFFVPIR